MLGENEYYVVKQGRQYIVAIPYKNTKYCRFSPSPYDAWMTRDREQAEEVARRTGGIMVLFNPIVNQEKVMGL